VNVNSLAFAKNGRSNIAFTEATVLKTTEATASVTTEAAASVASNVATTLHSAVICAKTAEAIQMPFGLWARMGPRNHVLDGGPEPPPWEGAIVKYRDFLTLAVQTLLNRLICCLGCGLVCAEGKSINTCLGINRLLQRF